MIPINNTGVKIARKDNLQAKMKTELTQQFEAEVMRVDH